jgi:GxxExxY protein
MLTDPFGTNKLTRAIVGCAIRVHDVVGPGVFESIYSECLQYELRESGFSFDVNRMAPVVYKGVRLKSRYFLDLVIEGVVPVELKSIETLLPVHSKQLLSQLRLTNLPVGLLINFNVERLVDGVKRVVNGKYKSDGVTVVPSASPRDPVADIKDQEM